MENFRVPDHVPSDFEIEPPSIPLMDFLVDDAYGRFIRNAFTEGEGTERTACDTFLASFDAISNCGLDSIYLASILASQTETTPEILADFEESLNDCEDYNELFTMLCQAIIAAEMIERYPEVVDEEDRRLEAIEGNNS